ncbi:MAG: cation-translocating P-type ATPase [Pseudomonadales bacterium]|nr:cation-translocating P-type ATPase [Pseudomonadales bacterium]
MSMIRKISELILHRKRRLWSNTQRSHFELRDLESEQASSFAKIVKFELGRREGVEWVSVNPALRRIVVSHDDRISTNTIDDILSALEIENQLHEIGFLSPSSYPGDQEPQLRTIIEMAADVTGLLTGFALNMVIPTSFVQRNSNRAIDLSAAITAIENLPALRSPLERAIGTGNTELFLGIVSTFSEAAMNGWSGSTIDIAHRYHRLTVEQSRADAWNHWEPQLCDAPEKHQGTWALFQAPNGFCELKGPIENYADTAAQISMGAFGYGLVASHNFEQAAASLFSTVPKPAMMGRDAFVVELAKQFLKNGVLVINPYALMNLDKINCVAIEGELLKAKQGVISYIHRLVDVDIDTVSQQLHHLFNEQSPFTTQYSNSHILVPVEFDSLAGELQAELIEQLETVNYLKFSILKERGKKQRSLAIVGIQSVVDSAAEVLVKRVADAGLKLAVLDHEDHFYDWASPDFVVKKEESLKEITILKERGFGVAVIAEGYCEAFAVSDIGLGLMLEGDETVPPWGADLISKEGLKTSWLLMESIFAARKNSNQCVELSKIDAFSGMILSITNLELRTIKRIKLASNLVAFTAMLNGIRHARKMPPYPSHIKRDLTPWHAMPTNTVLQKLKSHLEGLSSQEYDERTKRELKEVEAPIEQLSRMLVDELANPLAPVLAAGAGLSAVTGAIMDAALISAVVVVNAMIGAAQRYQTEQALHELDESERTKVTISRDGETLYEDTMSLVEGDVIQLEAGEVVPGDCRLLEAYDLEMDESSLTGESLPVKKHVDASYSSTIAERHSMIYEGTTIAAGRAKAVVVALDAKTEAHKGSFLALGDKQSGVEVRLNQLTDYTAPVAALSGIGLMASGLSRNLPASEVISSGVSLAVAAVPEGLPLLATMAQLGSAKRLSHRGALVRNPRAIESLGRMDVLCADKTGTLTEGVLKLRFVSDGVIDAPVEQLPENFYQILQKAAFAGPPLNNESIPHMTDKAIVDCVNEIRRSTNKISLDWQRVSEIPFKSELGYHAVLGGIEGQKHIMVKGAPDVLVERCDYYWGEEEVGELDDTKRQAFIEHAHSMADQGLRVLAIAEKRVRSNRSKLKESDIEALVFVGFVGIADGIRPAAKEAVKRLASIGVEVKMITGDHPKTASAIAQQLGLPKYRGVITGPQVESMSDKELEAVMPSLSVFARVTPAQKARIVNVLQHSDVVVGMTGDGSNDAPAIRLADVGIALGENATASARSAADLLVVDGRIETIVEAVIEGRALWSSVRDSVSLLVGGNLGEIGFALVGGIFSGASPLNARQLLLVNMLTDTLPALSVALRRNDPEELIKLAAQKPEELLGKDLLRDIQFRAAVTTGATSTAWWLARLTGGPMGASTVSMLTLVGSQLVQTLQLAKGSKMVIGTSLGSLAVLVGIVQTPVLSQFFGCRPLGPLGLMQAAGVTTAAAAVQTIVPKWFSHWLDKNAEQQKALLLKKDAGLISTRLNDGTELEKALKEIVEKQSS